MRIDTAVALRNTCLLILLLVIASLSCSPAFGQEPTFTIRIEVDRPFPVDDSTLSVNVLGAIPDKEVWLELKTPNFLIAGTASEKDIRKIAADLELMRWMYATFVPRANAISSVPTTVIVFRNGESYRPYRPLENGKPLDVKGYFQSGEDKNYIVLNASDGIPREVYRDYIRSLIPDSASPVPLWFRDGVSDYFSTLRINGYFFGKARWTWLGDTPPGYDRAVASPMSPSKMMPLTELFGVQLESPEYTDSGRFQFNVESWALTSFLLNGRSSGIAPIVRLFNLVADGESLEKGLKEIFHLDLPTFEENFKAYVRAGHKDEFTFRLGGLSLNPKETQGTIIAFWKGIADTGPVRAAAGPTRSAPMATIPFRYDETLADVMARSVRTLPEAEGYFYRGDAMLHLNLLPEADILLSRSLLLMPDLARAQAAIGLLRTMQGRFGDAAAPLAHSIEIDPDNDLAYYYDALRIKLESEHGGIPFSDGRLYAMHASLERVVALAPEFVQASEMLAEVNLARGKDLERSEKLLIDAIKKSPGRNSLFFTLARVAAETGDAATAGWLLNRVISSPSADPAMKGEAKKLVVRLGPTAAKGAIAVLSPEDSKADGSANGSVTVQGKRHITDTDLQPNAAAAVIRGATIHGVLTLVECTSGITLTIQTGDSMVRFHSSDPSKIAFVSHDSDATALLCGPVSDPSAAVTVTYKKAPAGSDILGEPLKVEFLFRK